MKNLLLITTFFLSALFLAACSSASAQTSVQTAPPPAEAAQNQLPGVAELQLPERTDEQGAVTVKVQPLPWTGESERLDFEIVLDTHSVDLTFDLAAMSVLSADSGVTATAVQWDAPSGGHHVKGKLSFPARVDDKFLLDETTKLTLTIKNVDAPERVFTWELMR
jgi:hypothetical protein